MTVVDAAGQRVPAAEVAVGAPDGALTLQARRDLEQRAWAGARTLTDDRGEAWLATATPNSQLFVYAREGDRWGEARVSEEALRDPLTVTLRKDLTLRARVVDPRGHPVTDVGVRICERADPDDRGREIRGATTDPDGVATYFHAQQLIDTDWGATAALVADITGAESVSATFRFDAIPTEPIELRLPAHGAVVVEVVGQDGAPHRGLSQPIDAELTVLAGSKTWSRRAQLDGSRLELPRVELGLRLRVELDSEELRGAVEFQGPSTWGELITSKLIAERQPTLRGRLVNERGEPQQGYWHAKHSNKKFTNYFQYFETTEDGRFEVPVPPMTDDASAPRAIRFERTIPTFSEQALLTLTDLDLQPGPNDLGDVVLTTPPILAAGWVVDDVGDPVVGAHINISYGDADGTSQGIRTPKNDGFVTDEQGAFEARAFSSHEELLLRVIQGANVGPRVAFAPPATGLRYVLPRVGEVIMPVTFVGLMRPEDAVFTRTDVATGAVTGSAAGDRFVDGRYCWPAIPPGRYDFAVRALGSPTPLASVAGVEVRASQVVTLKEQVVGAGVDAVRVSVLDEEGAAVEGAFVVVAPSTNATAPRTALPTEAGSVRLLVPETPCELLVVAPGFRRQTVYGVRDDATIRLERGLMVRMHVGLPAGALVQQEQLRLQVRSSNPAAPVGDAQPDSTIYTGRRGRPYSSSDDANLWAKPAPVDANGDALFYVPDAGAYLVEWEVIGESWRALGPSSRRIIRVEDSPQPTTIGVTLSLDDFR
ncbi:MAG: carboxypeptidase-like regulatory domain-containing protein [Planctomycetota bacterium]|nr:carboxypeptidase-like regulatory domain-containing protein [Planctomycetota bacterium]